MFAFELIALFFGACAAFVGLLALCSTIGSFLSSFTASVALFFQTLAAALMTYACSFAPLWKTGLVCWPSIRAAYVIGRNNFRSVGRTANLGKYNFGFMWAAVACLFLATVMFCVGGAASRSKGTYTKRTGGRSFMGRSKKSKRDRGSFIGTDGAQRKRREYSPYVYFQVIKEFKLMIDVEMTKNWKCSNGERDRRKTSPNMISHSLEEFRLIYRVTARCPRYSNFTVYQYGNRVGQVVSQGYVNVYSVQWLIGSRK